MALNDLTGQNIQDTYQKVVQTDGTSLADGTGSLLPISFDGNDVTISGSLTANEYVVSSSITNITIATLSGSTTFGDSADDTHTFTGNITASGTISSSGDIVGRDMYLDGNTLYMGGISFNKKLVQNIKKGFSSTADSEDELGLGSDVARLSKINTDEVTTAHITASGNISSSGTGSFSEGRFTGNVGIGTTTPTQKLEVNGYIAATRFINPASTLSYLQFDSQDMKLRGTNLKWLSQAGSERFRINGSGNVGIGTTTPTEKLTVEGNISASGIVSTVGGFGNYKTISSDQTIPADFNAVLYSSTYNPITISSGVNYTISAGADVAILSMNSI